MSGQAEAYARFRDLQQGAGMLVMPNPWDAASAILLKQAGFQALGTSSAAIAWGSDVPTVATPSAATKRSPTGP
jgi:2-methylisocitrate lyase-like PEP mutase family enzyme